QASFVRSPALWNYQVSGKTQTSGCTDGQRAASEPTRSYIAGNDFIIYCDQVPDVAADNQTHSICFRAFDSAPSKWWDLDNRIAQVVSYISKENVLLATSSCEKEYFLSTDSG
uniref:Fibrillar collagen NC1 domain-containing protein n=1 Tax=Mesocestoides corti TaxID=53468 RepID=A0A5K3G4P6_MESCO